MLVLASASPRRRELLIQAGLEFKVIPSSVPETLHPGEDAICFATRLAREKAQAVFAEQSVLDVPENPLLVLGADTIVVVDGDILGKPADATDAARMLTRLVGAHAPGDYGSRAHFARGSGKRGGGHLRSHADSLCGRDCRVRSERRADG